jgi:hypothetical protein
LDTFVEDAKVTFQNTSAMTTAFIPACGNSVWCYAEKYINESHSVNADLRKYVRQGRGSKKKQCLKVWCN